jgi:hypothetical protein
MTRCLVSGLQAMGVYDQIVSSPFGDRRLDANETAAMARELEHVFSEVYRKEFPDLKGRSLVPTKSGVPSGAEAHTYTELDRYGSAKIIHNYAKDFPGQEVEGRQFSDVIRSIGASYQYSIQDMRAAALTTIKMPVEKAEAARESVENILDDLVLNGDANTGLKGLNSSSLTTNFNAPTKVSSDEWPKLWEDATDEQDFRDAQADILADVRALFMSIPMATKNKHAANTLVLDTASYNFLAFTERGGAAGSSQSLLQYIMANVPGLTSVEVWSRLDRAGTSTKSRIFAYDGNPSGLYQVIPQVFVQVTRLARNMYFVINFPMPSEG